MNKLLFCLLIVFAMSGIAGAAEVNKKFLKTLPAEEQAMKDEVDHWGLPFSDQLRRFINGQAQFRKQLGTKAPENFIPGIQNGLEKIPLNKYWFKGKYTNTVSLNAAKNEYENFQVAVLPNIGKTLNNVQLSAQALVSPDKKHVIAAKNIRIYRVGYVKTIPARYPSLYTGMWPDILFPNSPQKISGTDLGLFWVEVKVPKDCAAGSYEGYLKLQADGESIPVEIKLNVYNFKLPDRVPFPVTVWTSPFLPWKEKMSPEKYRSMAGEFLRHGIDPISIGRDFVSVKNNDFKILDENLEYCFDRGMQVFGIPRSGKKPEALKSYIDHIRQKGWDKKALIYIGPDEPDAKMFKNKNIPAYQKFHSVYPDIKVFLASEYHPDIDKGCDIWMTDLSTGQGPEFAEKNKGKAELWFYFCHLPIRIDYFRPLVQAPNMQIDNGAVENRLTLWMCWKYGAEGMFIYAGNSAWRGSKTERLNWKNGWKLSPKLYGFPYAGIHNGNGYLIYPDNTPSIRMKIIRDGLEDYGYLLALKRALPSIKDKKLRMRAEEILKVPNTVLVNSHYFNRDPRGILEVRDEIGKILSER